MPRGDRRWPSADCVIASVALGLDACQRETMKTVDITYRYGAQGEPPRPRPPDSSAAHLRLNDGNRAFAALLEGLKDEKRQDAKNCFR